MSELQATRTAQQQQAQHSALISLLVTKTVRLQKEIGSRNRKLKVCYFKKKKNHGIVSLAALIYFMISSYFFILGFRIGHL
jgi:hypothetical protein